VLTHRHHTPAPSARRRSLGIALASWYLLVASYALFFAIDLFAPRTGSGGSLGARCGVHTCACSSVLHCRSRCCCDDPKPSQPLSHPAAGSFLAELACKGEVPLAGQSLPELAPVVLPELTWIVPPRIAAERPVAPSSVLPLLLVDAPEKVPITPPAD
jgi:hypothetical protein